MARKVNGVRKVVERSIVIVKKLCCFSCRENGTIRRHHAGFRPVYCDNCCHVFRNLSNYYNKKDIIYYRNFDEEFSPYNSEDYKKNEDIDEFIVTDHELKSLAESIITTPLPESDPGYSYFAMDAGRVIGKSEQQTLRAFTTVRLPNKVFVWLEP